jgi:hypothetical protein
VGAAVIVVLIVWYAMN